MDSEYVGEDYNGGPYITDRAVVNLWLASDLAMYPHVWQVTSAKITMAPQERAALKHF